MCLYTTETEQFIETIRKYPCVWNKEATVYKDNELKGKAGNKLQQNMDCRMQDLINLDNPLSCTNQPCYRKLNDCILQFIQVSSVLNKNNRSYGKNYMFDNCPETCWNSDAGTLQWIIIEFEQEYEISSFEIEFQGGFVGKNCHLEVGNKETKFHESFYPEDKNTIQIFTLTNPIKAKTFKFVFNESTDFFGRIIVYKLSLHS